MDLTARLLHRTPPRPLLVATVGGERIRLATERLCDRGGWQPAHSPAQANLLVVCGTPDEQTRRALDEVEHQIPLPRARAELAEAATVERRLAEALAALRDLTTQRRTRDLMTDESDAGHRAEGRNESDQNHQQTSDAPDSRHFTDDSRHIGHEHGADAHDHHGHGDMPMPGGLGMAERAEDRDGLRLDQVHLTLGPVLANWPAGLRLRLGMQGDVIQSAKIDMLGVDDRNTAGSGTLPSPVAALDRAQRLLTLAGWQHAALQGRALRDVLLDDVAAPDRRGEIRRWTRRVRRSRMLRWSIGGLGVIDEPGSRLAGDVHMRLFGWLDELEAAATGRTAERDASAAETRRALRLLPGLLTGTELAAARLIVASLELDLSLLGRELTHG